MALIRADAHPIPVIFPIGNDGYAVVTALSLSVRFKFQEDSLYVEEEIIDSNTRIVSQAIRQLSITNDDGKLWLLKVGKYRAYGLSISLMDTSTLFLTPRESSTCTIQMPLLSKVEVEPGLETIYELSDDSANESLPDSKSDVDHISKSPLLVLTVPSQESLHTCASASKPHLLSPPKSLSVVKLLKKLASRKRSKNLLSLIDYDSIQISQVKFLPPFYSVDIIFEFPPI